MIKLYTLNNNNSTVYSKLIQINVEFYDEKFFTNVKNVLIYSYNMLNNFFEKILNQICNLSNLRLN